MKIGIDCDGVLRDLIPVSWMVKQQASQHMEIKYEPTSWDWDQWLPFWTNDETEQYVFER